MFTLKTSKYTTFETTGLLCHEEGEGFECSKLLLTKKATSFGSWTLESPTYRKP